MVNQLAVRLRNAVALAGRYPLLAGADLDVPSGEILVLNGANGAGKTSLLRVVAGLVPLAAGEAMVLGLDPTADARELRRQVGHLGHTNGLYHDLTAEENVRFAARAARAPREAVPEALERLGVRDRLLSLPAARLSAGQRRRVALAALLVRRPQLWLLDEPHAGLDAEHRELLDGLLKDVTRAGATVIVASHEEHTSDVLANRVVTMSGGTVIDGLVAVALDEGGTPHQTGAPGEGGTAEDQAVNDVCGTSPAEVPSAV
jgi:heme ABC exporter ATP-binding subunit CcmA